MANKPPRKTDFFTMYRAHSNKQDGNSYEISQRKKPNDGSPAVLQTLSYPTYTKWEEQYDQRVPSNMAGYCHAEGKENRFQSGKGLSCSNLPLQIERCSDTENKRSTSQILALFSSRKNMPQPKIALNGQSVKVNEGNSGRITDRDLCIWNDTVEKYSSQFDVTKSSTQRTTSISKISEVSQQGVLDNDCRWEGLEIVEDLGDSLNLSPDSFAVCSSETKAESTVLPPSDSKENYDCDVDMGTVVYEDAMQESAFSKSPCNSQRQNEAWSQNDSESVSPLMRLLTNVGKDCTECGPRECVDLKDDGENPSNVDLGSPNSAPVVNTSVLRSSQCKNPYSTQRSSCSLTKSTLTKDLGSPDFVSGSFLSERDVFSCIPDNTSPSISKGDVLASYKKMLPSQITEHRFSINTNGFSSHPGSLYAYSELQGRVQNNTLKSSSDSVTFRTGLSNLEQWEASFEQNAIEDTQRNFLQSEMSPEFYPSETKKMTQWRVTPIGTTEVIPTDCRSVGTINFS